MSEEQQVEDAAARSKAAASWDERMAIELANVFENQPSPALFTATLEAAGELKTARLRLLLGRLWEVARGNVEVDKELQRQIEEALR